MTCGFVSEATGGGDAVQGTISNSTEAEIQGVTVEGVAVDYVSGTAFPIGIMQAGDYTTDQTGSTQDVAVNMTGVFTSIYFQDTLGVGQTKLYTGPGVYTFTNKKILPGGTDWLIQVN